MDALLLADSTFEFSVGAIIGLGAVAVGYGILRNTVSTLKNDFRAHEQLNREEMKELKDGLRDLERWQDRTKGAQRARDNGHSLTDTTETRSFSRNNKK